MVTQEASPQFLGFLYQIERALYRIFASEHDYAIFGIETADDVVEELNFNNGELHVSFEQDKHSLDTSGQPYQDSSRNLWHTLHIWLSLMKESQDKYDAITYCLVTNKKVGANTLANILSNAKTLEQIDEAVCELRKKALELNGKVKEIASQVLNFPEDELSFLIRNIVLLDRHGTITGIETKTATINLFHLPSDVKEHAETIYQSLLGLLVDKCKTTWKLKQPVKLIKEPFFNLLYAEINKIRRKRFIEQPMLRTLYKKYLEQDSSSHIFIEQLQCIGKSTEACNRALENYWAFYSEKIRLQDSGDIPLSAWDDRADELYNRWLDIALDMPAPANTYDKKLSHYQKIYSATINSDYRASLNGYETTHAYFTIGNYHELANETDKELFIHWHDNYKRCKDK
ncbi:TPA: ABC-three component system protein [Pluralibacter gergoviae]